VLIYFRGGGYVLGSLKSQDVSVIGGSNLSSHDVGIRYCQEYFAVLSPSAHSNPFNMQLETWHYLTGEINDIRGTAL